MNKINLEEQLKCHLKESIKIDIASNEILIYGAGNTTILYKKCFALEGIVPRYYIDKDEKKHHTLFQDVQVIYPEEIMELCSNPVVLISTQRREYQVQIKKLLNDMGVENYFVDEFLFQKHQKDIWRVYDSLEDTLSKNTYASMILSRMGIPQNMEAIVCGNQYFGIAEFQEINSGEVFADCGAYVGDSMEQYINMRSGVFGEIHAFEPEKRNFNAMKYRVNRLKNEWALSERKITLVNAGIAQSEDVLYLHGEGKENPALGAILSEERTENKIKMIALDEYFKYKKVGFIKADIEGYEAEMLGGGQKIIRENHPLLAICIYHSASDMYRIPKLVKSINPDYKLAVRQHQFSLAETVLYAY